MSKANLPLSHLTVLDLTRARAGPTAVRHLADWGADVIKIEMPNEPGADGLSGMRHGPDFLNLHRNKRSITPSRWQIRIMRSIEATQNISNNKCVLILVLGLN